MSIFTTDLLYVDVNVDKTKKGNFCWVENMSYGRHAVISLLTLSKLSLKAKYQSSHLIFISTERESDIRAFNGRRNT